MKFFGLSMRTKLRPPSSSASSSSPPRLCPPPSPPHPIDLHKLFDKFDADADGRISLSDLESLLRGVGSPDPPGEAASMVRAADLDGDGYVSLDEFVAVCGGGDGARGAAEDLRGAFEVYDRDGDGMITAAELHEVLRGVMGEGTATLAECQVMIRAVDRNGDGAVSFDEFEMMMTRSLAPN